MKHERRMWPRYSAHGLAGTFEGHELSLRNLSLGGALAVAEHEFLPGREGRVSIHLGSRSVRGRAKVVYSGPEYPAELNLFRIGVCFEALDLPGEQDLARYLESLPND